MEKFVKGGWIAFKYPLKLAVSRSRQIQRLVQSHGLESVRNLKGLGRDIETNKMVI